MLREAVVSSYSKYQNEAETTVSESLTPQHCNPVGA